MCISGKIAIAALLVTLALVPHTSASESPSPRHGARMIYDPVNQRVLLFGGAKFDNRYTFYSDLWVFDTASETWTRVEAPAGPQGRFNHNMVYDTDRHQIILFGGFSGSDRIGDTWTYSIAENAWARIDTTPAPPPRSDAGFVYDEAHGVAVLFGGYGLHESHPDDTWVFDPEDETWTQMSPPTSPPPMYGCMMVYDRVSQATLLHGGHWSSSTQSGVHGYISSVWVYGLDEDTWTEVQSSPKPSGRYWHMMAYDSSRGESLIYGGYSGDDNPKSDSWAYDHAGNTWTQVTQDEGPGPRMNTWIAYDEENDAHILFGGLGAGMQTTGLKGDTWILRLEGNRGSWTLVGEPPAEPPPQGIPGYPLAAITISLVVAIWGRRRAPKKTTPNVAGVAPLEYPVYPRG